MSRRKQAKPQPVRAEEEEEEEGGQRSPTAAAGGSSSSSFLSWPELSQDQRVCTEDPLDLLVKERLLEDVLPEDCPSPSVASSDLSAAESADAGLEPTHDGLDVLDEGGGEWDEDMDSESPPQDKNPTTSSPRPPDSAESSSSQVSGSGSYGAPSSNVTLEILHSTRVAVAQFSQGLGGSGLGGKASSASIPVILERLLALQQQQVQQLQLIQQICSQVAGMSRPPVRAAVNPESRSVSLPSNPGVVRPPLLPLSGTMPSAVNGQAAVSLPQSVPSQTFCGQLTSASSEKTPLSTLLPRTPHGSSQTPGDLLSSSCSLTFLPQSPPGSVIFPNPLASIAASTNALDPLDPVDPLDPLTALMKQQRCRPPNMTQFEPKPGSEEPFFKHKCRFCAKVFGSDSALQIHLRSHTGERPFKCNICGNRFSTKGNLKVHFQRHKDKYPHVQMNPFPVPEYLDTVPTSSGIPYGMSVPPERPVSSWLDSKPAMGTLTAHVSLPVCAGPEEPVSVPASVQSSQSESPEHRGTELRLSPLSDSSRETEAPKALRTDLPQTLRAHLVPETSSGAPTPEPVSPALLDSMQTSETSKLQRLVENIDKKLGEPGQCSVCRRVLGCQSALRMHRRVHTGERPFRCKVCGRAFTTKGNLKAHAGVHRESPSAPPRHSCPICQKKFSNAVVLQQHVRLHVAGQVSEGLVDEVSMEDEDEEEENVEDEDTLKPLISDRRCLSLSAAAVDRRLSVKDLSNGLRAGPPSPDGLSPQNKTGSSSRSSPGVSEPSRSPSAPLQSGSDASAVGPHQLLFASVKRERAESPKPAADLREEPNNEEEAPYGPSLQLSRDAVAGPNFPGSIKAEVNGHGPAEAPFSPGPTPLLGPAPLRRPPRQHNCSACGKNFSSASALQIHERTHTGEKPFVCSVCGRAFTTKGNLKVHMGTHMWNNAPARRGRRLSVENPAVLLRGEAFHKDLATRAVSVDPGFWSRYASAIAGSLALKNNEISVIQNPGLARVRPLTAASAAGGPVGLNGTTLDLGPNRHFSMLVDDSKQIGIN